MIVLTKPYPPKFFKSEVEIFKFVIQKLVYFNKHDKYYTHNQMASSTLRHLGTSDSQKAISNLKDKFQVYVETKHKGSREFRFKIDEIIKDFPYFCETGTNELDENTSNHEIDFTRIKDEIQIALQHEIEASIKDREKNTYNIKKYKKLSELGGKSVYDLTLKIDSDDFLKVYEGMPCEILSYPKTYPVEVLDFDVASGTITVHADLVLDDVLKKDNNKFRLNAVWLLEVIKERIQFLNGNIFKPLIDTFHKRTSLIESIEFDEKFYGIDKLSHDQVSTVTVCFKNTVSLIWGPPGTGKSTTLSAFILNAFIRKQKTLICCIANVAVDAITEKLLEDLEFLKKKYSINYQNGSILRVGYTRNKELMSKDFLFPSSMRIKELRKKIKSISEEIEQETDDNVRKSKISVRIELTKQLKEAINNVIFNATIIFCTASKMHADPIFEELKFDNLIIDEASMVPAPHFAVLSKNITERIIIAGDFRQLGPVVLSSSAMSLKWLHCDLFKLAGLKYNNSEPKHPALNTLITQRRFSSDICNLINKSLYANKLETGNELRQTRAIKYEPFPGSSVAFIDLGIFEDFKCESNSKHSRYNSFSADYIINKIIRRLYTYPFRTVYATIGIVTPYRAQVAEFTRLLEKADWMDNYFKNIIKIGTVHSFQGSEASLLIYDLVEAKNKKLGKLYQHETGARLVNVALSRAQSKLLVVGDVEAILNNTSGSNNIEQSVREIFRKIRAFKKSIP